MKKILLWVGVLLGVCMTSCIQDEAPNAECDVLSCKVTLSDVSQLFFSDNDAVKTISATDSVITFAIRENADLTNIPVRFELTEGATLRLLGNEYMTVAEKAGYVNGDALDFSKGPVSFSVVSQDGSWCRIYKVRFVHVSISTEFSFSNNELDAASGKYYVWYEYDEIGRRNDIWATGNPGFRLSKSSALPDEYPTVPEEEGLVGPCVKLVTRSTGAFGVMVKMRLAAGNLFMGTFDTENALKDAMKATCFGVPYRKKPLRFKGYYKYTPGPVFQDRNGKVVPDQIDRPDLYAVLFRNVDANGNSFMLHGNDVLTSDNIVAVAQVKEPENTNEWTYFDLEFEYRQEITPLIMWNAGYSLTVVFSSSSGGASFCGAVGSTLCVDEVEVISTDVL